MGPCAGISWTPCGHQILFIAANFEYATMPCCCLAPAAHGALTPDPSPCAREREGACSASPLEGEGLGGEGGRLTVHVGWPIIILVRSNICIATSSAARPLM